MNNGTINTNSTTNKEWSTDRIKKLTMSKVQNSSAATKTFNARNYTREFAAVAVVAAIFMLAFGTTALAATGMIDFNSIFQSIFGNEQAAPYVQTSDDIEEHAGEGGAILQEIDNEITTQDIENELDVEIVSVFADSGIYLEMQFTGAIGGSLSDNITLINWNEEWGFYEVIGGGTVSRRIDENATLANIILHSWVEDMYRIRFNMIASGVQFVEMQPTDINVGEHISMETPIVLPGRVVEITELELNGSELNMAYRESDLAVRGTSEYRVGVMKPSGEVLWTEFGEMTLSDMLSIAAGDADLPSEAFNRTINIGDADPNQLVFVWSGLQAESIITGNWDFTVTIDNRPEPGRFIGEYAGLHTEVAITATTVRVYFSGLPDANVFEEIWEENSLILYLVDGTTVLPRLGASQGASDISLLAYDMGFISPESVVRVVFRGVPIG
ncbi:MAG: hypothetical protein FWD05_08495 [Oscillospiraceae bacterium]|nr:hypothetical protein [Oscillospiraceae bacterium]